MPQQKDSERKITVEEVIKLFGIPPQEAGIYQYEELEPVRAICEKVAAIFKAKEK